MEECIPVAAVREKDSWCKHSIQVPEGEVQTDIIPDIMPCKQRLSHSALTAEVHHTRAGVFVEMLTCSRPYFFFIVFDSLHNTHPVISRVDLDSLYHQNSPFSTVQIAESVKIIMNNKQKFEYKTVQVYKVKKNF